MDIRAYCLKHCPGLDAAIQKQNHLEAVHQLREFAFKLVPWSSHGIRSEALCGKRPWEIDFQDLVQLIIQREIGLLCGGAAHFLNKLYQCFGYDSIQYSIGNKEGYNHAAVLVGVCDLSKKAHVLVFEDPTRNQSFHLQGDASLEGYHFLNVVGALRDERPDDVCSTGSADALRTVVYPAETRAEFLTWFYHLSGTGGFRYEETPQSHTKIVTFEKPAEGFRHRSKDFPEAVEYLSRVLKRAPSRCSLDEYLRFPLFRTSFKSSEYETQAKQWLDPLRDATECRYA